MEPLTGCRTEMQLYIALTDIYMRSHYGIFHRLTYLTLSFILFLCLSLFVGLESKWFTFTCSVATTKSHVKLFWSINSRYKLLCIGAKPRCIIGIIWNWLPHIKESIWLGIHFHEPGSLQDIVLGRYKPWQMKTPQYFIEVLYGFSLM